MNKDDAGVLYFKKIKSLKKIYGLNGYDDRIRSIEKNKCLEEIELSKNTKFQNESKDINRFSDNIDLFLSGVLILSKIKLIKMHKDYIKIYQIKI